MNVHLGDLEAYVQEKLARGGYGSASEVVREALREKRQRELEDAIERRLQSYVLKGIDQGPRDGIGADDWTRRVAATRERMADFIRVGLDELDGGEFVDGAEARERLRAKQAQRRRRKG